MVGWSRRSTESAERRRAWWASLTDEEKALEHRRSEVDDRLFLYTVVCIAAYFISIGLLFIVLFRNWAEQHPEVIFWLCLLGHPGGMIIGAFWTIAKRKQVK